MEGQLLSAGDDIKIWDCNGFLLQQEYNPHDQNISGACWSHDNGLLASASVHASDIAVTNAKNMVVSTLDCQPGCLCVDFNNTSRYLLSGASDGIISVWDLKSKKIRKTYKDHKGPVTSACFNHNSSSIASGSETGEIIVYNVVTGQGCRPMVSQKVQAIKNVQYSHHKKSLLGSVSDDGAVNLWDCNTRQLVHTFSCHRAPATGISFSPINDIFLMSVGLDKRIACHDVQSKQTVKMMSADSPLTSIDTMADGVTVAIGSTRGKIYQYDLRMGSMPLRTLDAHKSSVQCLRFQSDCQNESSGSRPAAVGKQAKHRQLPASPRSNRDVSAASQPPDIQVSKPSHEFGEDLFSPLREGFQDRSLDGSTDYRITNSSHNLCLSTGEGYAGGVFSPLNDNNLGRSSSGLGVSPLVFPGTTQYHGNHNHSASSAGLDYSRINTHDPIQQNGHEPRFEDDVQDGGTGYTIATQQIDPTFLHNGRAPINIDPTSLHNGSAPINIDPTSLHNGLASHNDPPVSTLRENSHSEGSQNLHTVEDRLGAPPPSAQSASRKQVAFAADDTDPFAFLTKDSSDSNDSNSPEIKRQRQANQQTIGISASPSFPNIQLDDSPGSATGVSRPLHATTPEGVNPQSSLVNMRTQAQSTNNRMEINQHNSKQITGDMSQIAELVQTAVQREFASMRKDLVDVLRDEIEDRTDHLHTDIINLQADMLRQFQIQQAEMLHMIEHYSVNGDLVAEVERLREELKRLKSHF